MHIYEMHQHTIRCSACATADPAAVVRQLKQDGFAGMVLTEHFYHGNTCVRRNVPWEDFIHPYEEAYRIALAEGERLDFDVLFGLEEGLGDGKEVLLYGITPTLLYEHPELRDGDLSTISRVIHEAGGLVFQAHPYRVRDYILRPWENLPVELLDGVEVHNAHNGDLENARAWQYADQNDLLPIAGSDDHHLDTPRRAGIISPRRLSDEAALGSLLRSQDYELYIED